MLPIFCNKKIVILSFKNYIADESTIHNYYLKRLEIIAKADSLTF